MAAAYELRPSIPQMFYAYQVPTLGSVLKSVLTLSVLASYCTLIFVGALSLAQSIFTVFEPGVFISHLPLPPAPSASTTEPEYPREFAIVEGSGSVLRSTPPNCVGFAAAPLTSEAIEVPLWTSASCEACSWFSLKA